MHTNNAQSQALATQLSEYRSQAAAKIASLAGRASLDAGV
jgi:hypothetical protein